MVLAQGASLELVKSRYCSREVNVRSYISTMSSDSVDGLVSGDLSKDDSVMTVGNSSDDETEMGCRGNRSLPVRTSVNSVLTGEEDIVFGGGFEREGFVGFVGVLVDVHVIGSFSFMYCLRFIS